MSQEESTYSFNLDQKIIFEMIGESGRKGTFDCTVKVRHLGIKPYYATELMQEVYWRSGERVKGCLGGISPGDSEQTRQKE